MDNHFNIDYSVDYSFVRLDWLVTTAATEQNITVDEYIKIAKDTFLTLTNCIIEEILDANNKQFILGKIEEINSSRCNWTHYDRYDFERKLPFSER